jgi:NAD(P)-dependent dehydrogenase (short-subunit alcohol dehydrogenase family)
MDLGLKCKTALVTGSSSGIGEAIAKILGGEGVRVVVHGRDKQRTAAVRDSIRTSGGWAASAVGDVSSPIGCETVIQSARSSLGGSPDILINNAGGTDHAPQDWASLGASDWITLFEQNFSSVIRLLHAFLPDMKVKGWGRIVNIASGWAISPAAVMPHYAAAKAALSNVTVSLAQDVSEKGITVNTVSPGPIYTPTLERTMRGIAESSNWDTTSWDVIEKRAVKEVVPTLVGRVGRVEEIAAAVAYLVSDKAGFVTSAHFRIDGGVVRSIV